MTLYKIYIDSDRKIVALPGWANPDHRKVGDSGSGYIVLDLTDDQLAKAVPGHSTLNEFNQIMLDDDYVPPVEPSTEPRPDPSSVALAGLSAIVAKQGAMIANLTLQVAQLKAGK